MVTRKKMKAWMRGEQQHDLGSAVVAGRGTRTGRSRGRPELRKLGVSKGRRDACEI